jgi:hypothetical protein
MEPTHGAHDPEAKGVREVTERTAEAAAVVQVA